MALFRSERLPEPEVMDEASEVEAYASAAEQAHLDALDNRFVERVVALGVCEGNALDVGCGPGQIALKVARALPKLRVVGIDRSQAMLRVASRDAKAAGLSPRVSFVFADAAFLGFAPRSFDLVITNSVLHHLERPEAAFNELARVTKPNGKVLLRDLRRPLAGTFALTAAWHGRHYSGRMRQLFEDSLRAAYTPAEIRKLVNESALRGAGVECEDRTHLTILWQNQSERPRG